MENTTHHYLDINILNNSQYDTSVPLVFSQTRTDNLIENASEYDLSIIRFSINSPILPLMSAKIDINQQDVNILKIGFKCIWSIFLNNDPTENKTKWVEMPLYFETQDKTIVQPTYPYNKEHFSDLYFNIHNFQQFINMLNLAIYKASLLLDTPISGVLPKFDIEPTSNRVILTYNPSTFITKTKCQIAFNGPLHTLLNGFNCGRINIFSTDELSIRKTIQIPTQYNNFFFSNVLHNNGVFFIEGAAPAINTLRSGVETSEGSAFKTFLLVNQNAGTIETSVQNPEFLKPFYNNFNVSANIAGILNNQKHSLYYNSVIYQPLSNPNNIFKEPQLLGTSSNGLIKTYDSTAPYLPSSTNFNATMFGTLLGESFVLPDIIYYRSPNAQPGNEVIDSTVITCVAGNYAAGYSRMGDPRKLNSNDSNEFPIVWNLKKGLELLNNRINNRGIAMHTEIEDDADIFVGHIAGTALALDGGQWFLGYSIMNNEQFRKALVWKATLTSGTSNYYPKTTTVKENTHIQFFGISQNETFLLGASVTINLNDKKQFGTPIIYNRETNQEIPIFAPNNDLSMYLTETEYQRDYKTAANAKFINNILYLTSNITFKTDLYSYNSDNARFEIANQDVITIPNFNLKDYSKDNSTVNLYGVDKKAKTPLGSMSVANPLVIYSDKKTSKSQISSNIYPIVSAFPVPIGETKIIQFNTSLQIGNNIHSINFSSNLLPISKSSIANPVIFNDQVPGHPFEEEVPLNSSNNSISNIVTDFTQYLGTGTEDRNMLLYNPSDEYRLVNLINNQPIRDIDLTVTYTDNFGVTFPLLLRPQCSATIKLMFRKKDFYNRN